MKSFRNRMEPKYIISVKQRAIMVLGLKLWSSETTLRTSTRINVEKVTVTISRNEFSKKMNENVIRMVPDD